MRIGSEGIYVVAVKFLITTKQWNPYLLDINDHLKSKNCNNERTNY